MINPDNKLGVNAAFQGRTTPNTLNLGLQVLSGRGIISGFSVTPVSGLTVSIGAVAGTPDAAIVQDDIGNRLIMTTRSTVPIQQTLSEAPDTDSRIDAIVIYTNNPPEVIESIPTADNPTVCAMLVVEGEVAANPTAPDDTAIRAAITADEASGATAYYAVLAYVTVEAGVTDITAGEIQAGDAVAATGGWQAGSNVQINGTTISATDTTYTAGNGLNLAGTQFSIDTSEVLEVGDTETYTIDNTSWAEASGISPFTYATTVTATHTIGNATIVELINDQAVDFAKFGFAIGSISGQSITLYALDSPVIPISLKINYKETA